MAYETLLYEQEGGILTITMNRPEKLNALNDTMLNELGDASFVDKCNEVVKSLS